MLNDVSGWVAPTATTVAAVMTASNLGARMTGWGFVVFTIGSISWCLVALASDQANLLWTNGFLIAVNAIGVWRWLGRRARFELGATSATEESRGSTAAALTSGSRLINAEVLSADGERLGRVVDMMVACDRRAIVYFIVSDGGLAGVGETLYAVVSGEAELCENALRTRLDKQGLMRRKPLEKTDWPAELDAAHYR